MNLLQAANGHLLIEFGELSDADWQALESKLVNVWGFQRVGEVVVDLDGTICPDFERQDLKLAAGWDIWLGYHLLSESAAGDEFLQRMWANKGKQRD
ncbi:hypothetical protein FGA82_00980 [Pseudomonas fluorescens]|uniref:hypothetical protein n=1 Tax=Pseudomonas fluorescens TaxID=294 RepID=UPI00113057BC|nr:hypothetical protein [Pseudomonas fluorescens]TMU83222.1 hypothetical protein FGA82_00980 [Pseudomonas fluorescens]